MSNKCLRRFAALMAGVCLGVSARAQSTPNVVTVNGELHGGTGESINDLHVELTPVDQRNEFYRVDVQLDGTFQVRGLRPGSYTLNVITFDGENVYRDFVTVLQQGTAISVTLPERKRAAGAPGTVSMKQLLHPPDRKALQALASAQRFSASGKPEKAAEELAKAIRISPHYAEAYNNLGVQNLHLGHFVEACENFEKAMEITGPNALILANLAVGQRELKHFPQAIAAARAALNLDRSLLPAHLVLGAVLVIDPGTREEGVAHLELAAKSLEPARQLLERVHQVQARSAN
ncbi:MAG: tetratricopeptide repeat protein [Candidatus Solibacter sp.]